MAHFQPPLQRRPYGTFIGGTRLFLSGNSGVERLVLETGARVTLELAGLTGAAAKPAIRQVPLHSAWDLAGLFLPQLASGPDIVSISALSGVGAKRSFTLTAMRPGRAALVAEGASPLSVIVGSFKNHPGMEHDLIANVFRASDPAKSHVLTRALFSNVDNLFNEQSTQNINRWGPLACGTVSKVGGAAVFFEKLDYDYKEYYRKPVSGRTRDAIKYDSTKLDRGLTAIQARLAKGIPSVAGLVYIPATAITRNGHIDVNGTGGHTVPIVGCSADRKKFLYIDVFQEGSKLKYEGGHAGLDLFPDESDYLGMFEMTRDAARGIDILRSTTPGKGGTFAGDQFLEVVAGPLTP